VHWESISLLRTDASVLTEQNIGSAEKGEILSLAGGQVSAGQVCAFYLI
jgi:hypothetical protein